MKTSPLRRNNFEPLPIKGQKVVEIRRGARESAAIEAARAAQTFNWQASYKVKECAKLIQTTIQWIESHQGKLPDETSAVMDQLLDAVDAALQPIR